MHKPKNEYDQALHDYARKWMNSLNKPRLSTNISNFFIAIFLILWASTITDKLGYIPLKGIGFIITLGIIAILILALLITNHILVSFGFNKLIRSAIWFSALIGPYMSIIVINNSGNLALGHIAGLFSSVLAFLLSYTLDRLFTRKSQSSNDS